MTVLPTSGRASPATRAVFFGHVVRRLSFRGLAMGSGIAVSHHVVNNEHMQGALFFDMRMDVPDRETGEPFALMTSKGVPTTLDVFDEAAVVRWVWEALLEFWTHELAESVLLDGRRVHELHPR